MLPVLSSGKFENMFNNCGIGNSVRNFREGLMCIILGAIFEIGFEPAMDTAKDIGNNSNIRLAVHSSQIGDWGTGSKIEELQTLNDICSWTSINYDQCNNDNDNDCCWIKKIKDNAYKGYTIEGQNDEFGLDITQYEEIIKFHLLREGNYTVMKSYLTQAELLWGVHYNQGMGWHRSEQRVFGMKPNRGYLANKKWLFNEGITIFIFQFLKHRCGPIQ